MWLDESGPALVLSVVFPPRVYVCMVPWFQRQKLTSHLKLFHSCYLLSTEFSTTLSESYYFTPHHPPGRRSLYVGNRLTRSGVSFIPHTVYLEKIIEVKLNTSTFTFSCLTDNVLKTVYPAEKMQAETVWLTPTGKSSPPSGDPLSVSVNLDYLQNKEVISELKGFHSV